MNPSLIQKGLRHTERDIAIVSMSFESFPDSEGIKTPISCPIIRNSTFESFPDSEGIKTDISTQPSWTCCLNPSLIQKGLRLALLYPVFSIQRCLNPSLIQKGLRPQDVDLIRYEHGLNPSLIQKGLRLKMAYLITIDPRLNPSLIQKGLRHVRDRPGRRYKMFESFPDSEGIKTSY